MTDKKLENKAAEAQIKKYEKEEGMSLVDEWERIARQFEEWFEDEFPDYQDGILFGKAALLMAFIAGRRENSNYELG